MAYLKLPAGVAFDASGNMYIADAGNHRVRKVDTNGIISTIAGTGMAGFSGDGGLATSANLSNPLGVAVDNFGNVYLSDAQNNRIRKIDSNGIISTIAGTGLNTDLNYPTGLAVDVAGNVYIADNGNHRIRKINTSGNINTLAGTGVAGFSGDGGLATSAKLYNPKGVAVDASGNIYIADTWNSRLRKISPSGISSTIAGDGFQSYGGDGGAATIAQIGEPGYVAIDGLGNVCFTDTYSQSVRKIDANGIISTIAGRNPVGFYGDGGMATFAGLNMVAGLAISNSGIIYFADSFNNRIRMLSPCINCSYVWPGDANSDGTVNNIDVLELGLHYTQTGTPRTSVSNVWQSFHADNWTGTISNGQNVNHSDCNGDGTINDDDTLAIYNNYGLTHAFKQIDIEVTNPQLSIVSDQAMVTKGSWGSSSIYLGDISNPISNINGIAFTVDFDNTLIETNSIYIEYENSFLDASNQNLDFRKLDFANGKVFTATTHTNNVNANGYGKIATLHYQIKSSLTTDEVLNVALIQANQSDASGVVVPLTSGTATLMALGSSVGLNSLLANDLISISPNPATNELTVRSNSEITKIEITNLTGQVILSEQTNSKNHKMILENVANGVYFVKVYNSTKQVSVRKLVVQK